MTFQQNNLVFGHSGSLNKTAIYQIAYCPELTVQQTTTACRLLKQLSFDWATHCVLAAVLMSECASESGCRSAGLSAR
jgi:hypothetical protein